MDLLFYPSSQICVGDPRPNQIERVAEALTKERQRAESAEKRVRESREQEVKVTRKYLDLSILCDKMGEALRGISQIALESETSAHNTMKIGRMAKTAYEAFKGENK